MKRAACIIALLVLLQVSGTAFAQDDVALPAVAGRIAYVGTDFNVYVLDGDGSRLVLTDDAGVQDGSLRIYQWPTWSTDGRLAYFSMSLGVNGEIQNTDVYVSNGEAAGERIYSGDGEVFNYAYWSPQNCDGGANCRDLAVLLSNSAGLFVELIRDNSGEESGSTLAGRGGPFYYSWSPDGTRMLWQRNNQQLDIFDVGAGEVVETLPQTPGVFSSPGWSPVDDRLLFGVLNAETSTTDLVIVANGETRALVEGLEGSIAFAWSPNGNYIAYTNEGSPLVVLDAVTGETIARSPVSGVLSYFWSPDSSRIAYITLANPPGSFSASDLRGAAPAAQAQGTTGLAWSVLEIGSGANRRFGAFIPTRDMVYLLSFFDQFAQSHRVWSPDSQHVIYGEVTPEDQPVITLLDVISEDSVPLSVAEGTIGVWSFE